MQSCKRSGLFELINLLSDLLHVSSHLVPQLVFRFLDPFSDTVLEHLRLPAKPPLRTPNLLPNLAVDLLGPSVDLCLERTLPVSFFIQLNQLGL